jgi:type II secretory pathway pseudopilin PulG
LAGVEGQQLGAQDDRGYGLVGVLVALLILGGLAAVALTSLPDNGRTSRRNANNSISRVANQPPQAQISAAAQQACLADYAAIEQAASAYQIEHGSTPTNMAELQTYLRQPVSASEFTFSIDPARPGQIQVQTKGHPASDGNANCRYAEP